MARAILFDLDGTLVDTRTASWDLFAETNAAFGLGIDTREAFFKAFESNFFESLARLPMEPSRLETAKQHFMQALRERYSPPFIPGMADVVRALAPHCIMAVVSTNDIGAIRRILVNEGLATCFSHVFSGDVEPRKSVSIRRFLSGQGYGGNRLCAPSYQAAGADHPPLHPDDVVLVTDTVGDVVEAVEAGVRAIGVSWGMHSERQLLDAGAQRVALWPQELLAWLRGNDQDLLSSSATASSSACSCHLSATSGDAVDPAASGALRRTEQLQRRQQAAQRIISSPTDTPAQSQRTEREEELRQALARIMGGPT
ncbi:MAG: HAD family hydrolase [Proteobacteria bacterium]|nr:HAD family hydrolase [Pseudomonadota bacterium]